MTPTAVRIAAILSLVLTFILFQNFSCTQKMSFSNERSGSAYSVGGNGEPTDGKPGTYYRWVDGFKCKGNPALIGVLQISASELKAKILDQETCALVDQPLKREDLTWSHLDSHLVGAGSGVYVFSETAVAPASPPDVSVETFCRSKGTTPFELLIKHSRITQSLTFEAASNQKRWAPVSVIRQSSASTTLYASQSLQLTVDRVASLNGPEVSGRLIFLEGADFSGALDLACRTGSRLDPFNHFSPARQFDFFGPTLPAGFTLTRSGSASYFDASGVLRIAASGTPRFDFDPFTGLAKGLLIEKAGTNLFTQSQDLEQWTVNGYTAIPNTTETRSPAGLFDAELFRNTNVAVNHQVLRRLTLTPDAFYTFSFFIKPTAIRPQRLVRLQIIDELSLTNQIWANFDLIAGTIDRAETGGNGRSASARIERLSNGWLRVSVSGVPSATSTNFQIFIESLDFSTSQGVYADSAESGYYLYGAQLEQSEVISSYIPTLATAVTRAGDLLTSTDVSWWDTSIGESSLMLERAAERNSLTVNPSLLVPDTFLSLLRGLQEIWSIEFDRNGPQFTSQINNSPGSTVTILTPGLLKPNENIQILRAVTTFDPLNITFTIDGVDGTGAHTSGSLPPPDQLVLGAGDVGSKTGHIQVLRYWPFQLEPAIRQQLSRGLVPK